MEKSKIGFFIIKSFNDLIFERENFKGKYQDESLEDMLNSITPYRSQIKFESEFGGDGTKATVIYGASTYSTRGKDNNYDTFEIWYSDEEEPRGYESKEQINDEFLRRSLNIVIL
jgi:hypothetical protein